MQDFDPELWLRAEDETTFRRQQIQLFLYTPGEAAETSKPYYHVLRDCWKADDQVIWSAYADKDSYDQVREEMRHQARLHELKTIKEHYDKLKLWKAGTPK